MGPCFRLRSMAAGLMVALAASAASANLTLPDDREDEKSDDKKGGNAIDKATPTPNSAGRPGDRPGQPARPTTTKTWPISRGHFMKSGHLALASIYVGQRGPRTGRG